jgi:hypothetical protein
MAEIAEMIGKEVEVLANGVKYQGTLIEVSDTEVHIKTTMQWVSLPASSVSQVKLAEKKSAAVADKLNVEISKDDPYGS